MKTLLEEHVEVWNVTRVRAIRRIERMAQAIACFDGTAWSDVPEDGEEEYPTRRHFRMMAAAALAAHAAVMDEEEADDA